ncbi:MAG: hypothetical protein KF745_12375 [Phycisphaeraceae bacterium]|nr:hypothetical protein [Phycisphaeraceae bacterium]
MFAALVLATSGSCTSDGAKAAAGGIWPARDPNVYPLLPTASTLKVEADWYDLDAALLVTAPSIEAAVEAASEPDTNPRLFSLRTIAGEPATLEITAEPGPEPLPFPRAPADSIPPVTMTMRCTVGLMGDPAREKKLLEALAARLRELRGRDFAPLPE